MSFGRCARLGLLAALLVACGDDDGAAADGGVPLADAGGPADARADALIMPDAEVCPGTCIGSLVGDFTVQPNSTDRFRYLDDKRSDYAAYAEMVYGAWHGGMAWIGQGDEPRPAVLHCPSHSSVSECQGVEARLILTPGKHDPTSRDPVVAWTSPITGQVRVVGSYRSPISAIAAAQPVTLVRNSRHDLVHSNLYLPGQTPVGLAVDVDVQAGDRLLLTVAAPSSGFGAPVGFTVFYVDTMMGSRCALIADFETDPLVDTCSGAALTATPGTLSRPASHSPEFGAAVQFAAGDHLERGGGPLDYSADFTIQFWARIAEPATPGAVIYADADCAAQGGVQLAPVGQTLQVVAFYASAGADYCGGDPGAVLIGARPTDDDWHFFRLVRRTDTDTFTLCIDGVNADQVALPGDADMTPSGAPFLGKDNGPAPAVFAGELDDLRVFTRALPCE